MEYLEFDNGEEAADDINKYVSEATKGLISDIAEPSSFNALTKMIIINAIYFKGTWNTKFEKSDTRPMQFKVTSEKTIKNNLSKSELIIEHPSLVLVLTT